MKFVSSIWEKVRGLVVSFIQKLKEPIPLKTKILILSPVVIVVLGGAFGAYRVYNYTQNNPNFCVGCHIMQPAFASWSQSEHKDINCHECHHLSVTEMNQLLISFVLHRPTAVPERHGKVIVSDHYCNKCHSEGAATKINRSLFHAKHVYMEQIGCTQCHGELKPNKEGLHRFLPSEKFCLKCHPERQVHGEGMGGLACINCHTERTTDFRPGRKKCLYCHGTDESVRNELIKDGTIDVRYFKPSASTLKKAKKITFTAKSPMQINCYECHKPHTQGKLKPNEEDCLRCHPGIRKIGKHKVHLNMDMQCKQCHQPHEWKVTEAVAKSECVKCHEYRSPSAFLQ